MTSPKDNHPETEASRRIVDELKTAGETDSRFRRRLKRFIGDNRKHLPFIIFIVVVAAIGAHLLWPSFAQEASTDTTSSLSTNINYNNLSAVQAAYDQLLVPALSTTPDWTGSVKNCDPGTMSNTARSRQIDAINFARRLEQLAPVKAAGSTTSANDMKEALIMEANGETSDPHNPPKTLKCWTQAGATAAGESLLSFGSLTVGDHVGGLLEDNDTPDLGHRLFILDPIAKVFGIGTSTKESVVQVYNVPTNISNPHPDVMWPMKGYFPSTLAPGLIDCDSAGKNCFYPGQWSYTIYSKNFSFSKATLSVKHNGVTLAVKKNLNIYSDGSSLGWKMPLNYDLTGDYNVVIKNIYNSHTHKYTSRSYTVHFFDPAPPKLKLVTIVHNYNGGTKTPHDWTLTAKGAGGFSDSGDSTTFHKVEAGITYTLLESSIFGYKAGSAGWWCNGGNQTGVGTPNSGNITLGSGENVTCSIDNFDVAPTLTVVKNVVNSHGGTKIASDFTVKVNATTLTSGVLSNDNLTDTYTDKNLTVGSSYTVSEVSPASMGYFQTSLVCTDNDTHVVLNNPFTLNLGQNVTCTITNSD